MGRPRHSRREPRMAEKLLTLLVLILQVIKAALDLLK